MQVLLRLALSRSLRSSFRSPFRILILAGGLQDSRVVAVTCYRRRSGHGARIRQHFLERKNKKLTLLPLPPTSLSRPLPSKKKKKTQKSTQQFLFINRKAKSLFAQRKKAAKIAWTTTYRKDHKKDLDATVARKKRRSATKATARAIVGASLEVINKRRAEKPEARKASREAAIREVKEKAKKTRAEKAASRAAGGGAAKAAKGAKGGFAPAPVTRGKR